MDELEAAELIVEQLFTALKNGELAKVGLDELERQARKRSITFPRPATSYREIRDLTVRLLVEKAAG